MQTEARVGMAVEGGGLNATPSVLMEQRRQRQIGTASQLFAGGLAGAVGKTCTAPLARLTILFQKLIGGAFWLVNLPDERKGNSCSLKVLIYNDGDHGMLRHQRLPLGAWKTLWCVDVTSPMIRVLGSVLQSFPDLLGIFSSITQHLV